jgi:PAS domain S-box-containing protein
MRTLLEGRDGVVWIGAAGRGLLRWDGERLEGVGAELFRTNGTLSSVYEDSRGRLWVGEEQRVGYVEGGVVREVVVPRRDHYGGVVFFCENRDGVLLAFRRTVYVHTAAGGLRELVTLPEDARVSGLLVDGAGRLWVGTNGQGLYAYAGGELRRLGMSEGLPSEAVGSLVLDGGGRMWFSSARKAVQADPEELWRAAGSGREDHRWRWFGQSDGLRGLDFSLATQPGVGRDGAGRLWFALVRGLAMVDPAQLKFRDLPPRVLIESLRYLPRGGRLPVDVVLGGGVVPVLPAGTRQVELRYTALEFSAVDRHRFRVRLGGERAEWQDMGGERVVTFFELPPGRHEVRVAAAGADSVWNLEGASQAFAVAPFYWQTVWFRAGAVVGVLGMAGFTGWLVSYRRWRQWNVQVALRQLASSLTAAVDARALGRLVAGTCRALFRNDAFFLVLVDRLGGVRLVAYAEDTVVEGGGPKAVELEGSGSGLVLGPVLGGEALLRNGVVGEGVGMGDRRLASMMIAPIRWEGATVGVVGVRSYVAQRYRRADLDQLQMLAAHCGAAIARMEAEERVRENEERLRLAMETARLGSWEMDLETGELAASAEAEAVYGYGAGAMSGDVSRLWERVPVEEAVEVRRQVEAIRAGGGSGLDVVHRWVTEEGERWLEVKGRVHGAGGGGATPRLIGISADVTARRQAERIRERLEEQLRQSQKQEAIGTLAGGIAHDFNNILAVILGNVETARFDAEPGAPIRESLDEIHRAGMRARDLVRRILAFSRPQEHQREVVRLGLIVQEVAKLLRSTIPAGVEIVVEAEEGVPPVLADPSQMHQVLLNLGTNAWHAIEGRAGRILFRLDTVRADPTLTAAVPGLRIGGYARVQVIDNGHGMTADTLARIFDPFFTTKPPGKGTGLGLPMALAIVRSHDGVLAVESAPGRGSAFSLYLPESPQDAVGGGGDGVASAVVKPVTGGRLLFVDDEEGLVRVARRILQNAGYTVESFLDPLAAVERFRAEGGRFDVLVTDLAMPGMSGLDLVREARVVRTDLAVLLCSGNLPEAELMEAQALGGCTILPKPYSSGDLLRALAGVLGRVSDGR